jgi:putative spermidine/putrescine transport system permease protein
MRLSRRNIVLALTVPVLLYVMYLLLPLWASFRMSLNTFTRMGGTVEDVTLDTYASVLGDGFYRSAWLSTLRLALISGLLTVLIATVVAYALWRVGGRARAYLTVIVIAPLMVSSVVRAYGWVAAIGPQGLVPSVTEAIGLGAPSLLFDRRGVIIGFVHILLPFAVLILLARFDSINPRLLAAAGNLGASQWQTIRRVVLPLIARSTVAAFLIVFALATGSYAIPAVLGGGRVRTVTRQIVQDQLIAFDWPRAATLAVLLSILTLIVMLASQLLLRRRRT